MTLLANAYKGKRVLLTGHTGFKGSWLAGWLQLLGAKVVGLALDPPTDPSHFAAAGLVSGMSDLRIDVRDRAAVRNAVVYAQPDFVFHLAAQSIVRRSHAEPIETWETNVMGTLNVLEALRVLERPCAAVLITSDKCYDNVEWVWGYRETDALGGPDPYSASKGAAELAIRSYIKSYFPRHQAVSVSHRREQGTSLAEGTGRRIGSCRIASGRGRLVRRSSCAIPWLRVHGSTCSNR